jgi:ubiquitin-conjugating enzyme E2 H
MAWAKRAQRDIKDLTDNGFVVKGETLGAEVSNLKCFCVLMKCPKDTP